MKLSAQYPRNITLLFIFIYCLFIFTFCLLLTGCSHQSADTSINSNFGVYVAQYSDDGAFNNIFKVDTLNSKRAYLNHSPSIPFKTSYYKRLLLVSNKSTIIVSEPELLLVDY